MAVKREGYHDLFAQIPDECWQALCAEADAENRSATAQLIRLLKERYGLRSQDKTAPDHTKKGKR